MKLLLIFLSSLFNLANTNYESGNYAEAIEQYQQVIEEQPAADAYYNLGNAYFKQGELAQSILAYERALRIDPDHKDAIYNLQFAQSKIEGKFENDTNQGDRKIKNTRSFFLHNWLLPIRNALSTQTWMILSISLFIATLVGLFIFAFSHVVWVRKTAFYSSIVALVISIESCVYAGSLHKENSQKKEKRSEAIITQGIVRLKASPTHSGTNLYELYEGMKVKIIDTNGDWYRVEINDNEGWLPKTYLERI